jgi:hypothetical protein
MVIIGAGYDADLEGRKTSNKILVLKSARKSNV